MEIAIIVSEFNRVVTEKLLAGARETLEQADLEKGMVQTYWVPGAYELPLAAKWLAERNGIAGMVALGCVMTGETRHDEYVCGHVLGGLGKVSCDTGLPIGLGVLTVRNQAQALARAGGAHGNRGSYAAKALLSMLKMRHQLK